MSHHIDPAVMYRIRSRGVERPAVEGHRLPQLVRDFMLARHDELSEDGELWFPASEVESLFPTAANARLIRERLHRDPGESADEEHHGHVEDDRKFPREPWYVARASNVAGPYDQLTIAQWYEEGCLRDNDQLRPGLHAKWRSLGTARNDGLLDPPPENTCSVNPMHLVADPPVWMGPPTNRAGTANDKGTPTTQSSEQVNSSTNLPLILASASALALFLTSLAGIAWYVMNLNRQDREPAERRAEATGRPTEAVAGSLPANSVEISSTVPRSAPPQVENDPKSRSAIPINRPIAIRLQTPAFSLTLDKQTIHQGSGVYEISLLKVPDVDRSIEFEITEPDSSGIRDLIAVAATGDQRRIGTIFTDSDQVQFAWSPTTSESVAAAFVLTHEILIRDDTHHNTIQFEFANPATLPTPPTPVTREFVVPIPRWVPPEFDLLLKPTFTSIDPDKQLEFDPFPVLDSNASGKSIEKNLDLTALGDDWVDDAKLLVKGDISGNDRDRRIRFSSMLILSGPGAKPFDWSRRNLTMSELVRKHNQSEMNKDRENRVLMTREAKLDLFESWADRLSCQLELYVRVADRDILCGKTAEKISTGYRRTTVDETP